jgi:hypothetical protein
MSRIPIAVCLGLGGFLAYTIAAVILADRLGPMPWPVQLVYFAVAGVLWVFPARWLMLWAAHLR